MANRQNALGRTIAHLQEGRSLVKLAKQYTKLETRNDERNGVGCCPFCKENTFAILDDQKYMCFSCGESGDVTMFLMKVKRICYSESIKELCKEENLLAPSSSYYHSSRKTQQRKEDIFTINQLAQRYFLKTLYHPKYSPVPNDVGAFGDKAMDYLLERGLSAETIHKFGLGFAGTHRSRLVDQINEGYSEETMIETGLFSIRGEELDRHLEDKYSWRITFPIQDVDGKIIGFGGRTIDADGSPKYLNSVSSQVFDKSRTLYGLNHAIKSSKNYAILCEGYMDVISLHQAGFDSAVATLGTAITESHAQILKNYWDRVLICYDSDAPGRKAALKAIPILRRAGLEARVLDFKPFKDPDEFLKNSPPEDLLKRMTSSVQSIPFSRKQYSAMLENCSVEKEREKIRVNLADALAETASVVLYETSAIRAGGLTGTSTNVIEEILKDHASVAETEI